MIIKLKVFASIRDICGFEEKEIHIPAGITVEQLIDLLSKEHCGLASKRESLLVAVNEEYAAGSRMLAENDTVALFPPVSGG